MTSRSSETVARRRWQILGQALKTGNVDSLISESTRRFKGFGLFSVKQCDGGCEYSEDDGKWFQYSSAFHPSFDAPIRHCLDVHTLNHLTGFNNTGNVGVWPSEEVMAHFCLQNKSMFVGKSVCEVGGGMTCLAGIAVWMCVEDSRVVVSDGNDRSVHCVEMTVNRNSQKFDRDRISVRKICWDSAEVTQISNLAASFDYVLCADCLFFKETVEYLAEIIHYILKPDGVAIVVAPSRNSTFQHFFNIAKAKFRATLIDNYDETVTERHQQNLKHNEEYCEDLHYPRMIQLAKS